MKRCWTLLASLIAPLVLTACLAQTGVPSGAKLQCARSSECPAGMVCAEARFCLLASQVDTTTPDLQSAPTVSPPDGKLGTPFTIGVTVTKELAEPPAVTLEMNPPGVAPCVPAGARTYTCSYTATGHENDGNGGYITLDVQIVDRSGHVTLRSFVAALQLDFHAPVVVGTSSLALRPPPHSVIPVVTAAKADTPVELSFTLDEPVLGHPDVVAHLGATSLPFSYVSVEHNTWVYGLTVPSTPLPPGGSYSFTYSATDLAGNPATDQPLPALALVLVTTPPTPPDTTTPLRIVYSRAPWGSVDSPGLPVFSLAGLAGAVPGGTAVIVYDGPETGVASELGRGPAQPNGSFGPITLNRADRAVVYVAAADAAGNLSTAMPIHDVSWTATFGGKTPGVLAGNPHRLELTSDFALTAQASQPGVFLGPLLPDPAGSAEPMDYTPLWKPMAFPLSIATGLLWAQRRPVAGPVASSSCGLADDSARGCVVLYCGTDVWEWNGSTWTDLPALTIQPPSVAGMTYDSVLGRALVYDGTAMWNWDGAAWTPFPTVGATPLYNPIAYDSRRDRVVLFDNIHTWEWDGKVWAMLTPATSPPKRIGDLLVYDAARGVTVLFGGHDAHNSALSFADTWTWDGQVWTNLSGPAGTPAPPTRSTGGIAYDPFRERVVLFGGYRPETNWELGDTWEWDGTQWTRIMSPGLTPPSRRGGVLAFDSTLQRVLLFGGTTAPPGAPMPTLLSDVWSWDGARWVDLTPSTLKPSPRQQQGAAFDAARQQLVMFGGADEQGNLLGETWTWNGFRWKNPTPATGGPTPRFNVTMAYDASRHRTVLFGGVTALADSFPSVYTNETWEWDGAQWFNVTPASGPIPSPRAAGALVYADDGVEPRVLLLGGNAPQYDASGTVVSGGDLADLWTWDGTHWVDITPAPATPPLTPRQGMLAYDAARKALVLFGLNAFDDTGAQQPLNDTWEWAGMNWTQLQPNDPTVTNPPQSLVEAFVYDAARGHVLMVDPPGNGMWEWDGAVWNTVALPGVVPPPQNFGGAVYDTVRQRTIIAGGLGDLGSVNDVWEAPSNIRARAAAVATFSFAAAGEPAANIQGMEVRVQTAGKGNALTLPGDGVASPGVTLVGWDRSVGAWRQLTTNTADLAAPTDLAYHGGVEAAQYLLAGPQTINLAVFSTLPRGNGLEEAQVVVGQFQMTVAYRR